MNKQRIFDIISDHLLTQGKQSMRTIVDIDGINEDEPQCAYRGEDGMKCALGILMPDEAYNETLEGGTVVGLHIQDAIYEETGPLSRGDLSFLDAMQRCHDQMGVIHSEWWPNRLKNLAEVYELVPNAKLLFEVKVEEERLGCRSR